MTATYDLATLIGQVRLLIDDKDVTPATDAHFTDEELQVFLDLADDDVYIAAALALESWATSLKSTYTSEKIGDYSYSKKSIDDMLALAKRYRDSSGSGPVFDWSSMDLGSIGEYPVEESE